MNPSGRGWITKLLKLIKTAHENEVDSLAVLYPKIRAAGFLYGSNVGIINYIKDNTDYTKEERCKINLLIAFYAVYKNSKSEDSFEISLINFYKEIKFYESRLINRILGDNLESILHKRIHIDNNILTKNFSFFVTNALLFIDVLAFKFFLDNKTKTVVYLKHCESLVQTLVIGALNSKSNKTSYDHSLIKLLETSLRFNKRSSQNYKTIIDTLGSKLEANYYLDLACMTAWSDLKFESNEHDFLNKLGNDLKLPKTKIEQSINAVQEFYNIHKNKIALFNSKNIAHSFYDNSSLVVRKLISRNSKRLYKELKESKELVLLISQSTHRDLSEQEQKQMQDQLLDLLKSVPSLAIFMLPGGAILLPLFVKFIPKLLPSAFDENRIND
jgi:hypothetical protein|tara:strand:+ start:40321 stop:41478 length:1158 start_codon:yes stop_codon:yes gene_type:complete